MRIWGGRHKHERHLFHEDCELNGCGWYGEGADVIFDYSFAVEVEDPGDLSFCDCWELDVVL